MAILLRRSRSNIFSSIAPPNMDSMNSVNVSAKVSSLNAGIFKTVAKSDLMSRNGKHESIAIRFWDMDAAMRHWVCRPTPTGISKIGFFVESSQSLPNKEIRSMADVGFRANLSRTSRTNRSGSKGSKHDSGFPRKSLSEGLGSSWPTQSAITTDWKAVRYSDCLVRHVKFDPGRTHFVDLITQHFRDRNPGLAKALCTGTVRRDISVDRHDFEFARANSSQVEMVCE